MQEKWIILILKDSWRIMREILKDWKVWDEFGEYLWNRRRRRCDEEMGGVFWSFKNLSARSSKNWNPILNPIENRFMILLWMEKMKNWLQSYLFCPVFLARRTIRIKLLFILPLKEIILQLVNFSLIWELICFWHEIIR